MTLNLSLFWALAILMVLIGCLFIVVPIIRFSANRTFRGLKSEWYKSRVTELEQEKAKGQFSEQEYQDALIELKLTATGELRDEVGVDENENQSSSTDKHIRNYMIAGLVFLVVFVMTFYHYYGQQNKLQKWQDALERMPELTQQVLSNQSATPSTEDLQDFALGLRTKLSEDPQAIGWMLLGRNLQLLGDIEGAVDAFDKSFRMDPNSIATMMGLATSLQQNGKLGDYKRSLRVLKRVLSIQPTNLTALILTAEGQMLDEQLNASLESFQLIDRIIPQTDSRASAVKQRIAYISQQLGDPQATEQFESPAQSNAIAGTQNNTKANTQKESQKPANSTTQVVVNLEIDDSIDLTQFKSLFVFAKQPGVAMPLAVKKLSLEQLQGNKLQIVLDETNVMVQGMSLADQSVIEVIARLSKDTSAPLEKGDLQAIQNNITLPLTAPLSLKITKEEP